ncbi:MAG: hypothetical protein AAGA90_02715 [Actinomycetota bacterium]
MGRLRTVVLLTAALGLGATSCGTDDGDDIATETPSVATTATEDTEADETGSTADKTPSDAPADPADPTIDRAWTTVELGDPGVDSLVVGVAANGHRIIATAHETGAIGWIDIGDGFVEQPLGESSTGFWSVAAALETDAGVVVAVNDYETFIPQLWINREGTTWAPLPTTGIDRPIEVVDLVATADGVFLAGALRGEDLSVGPFTPGLFRSTDLETWSAASVDADPGGDGVMLSVAEFDGGLIASGRGIDGGVLWRSDDGGATWTLTPGAAIPGRGHEFRHLARVGDRLVAVGELWGDAGPEVLVAVTTDGRAWTVVDTDGFVFDGVSWVDGVTVQGDAIWVTAHRWFDAWSDPDRCYVDLDACESAEAVLLHSVDGTTWNEVDLGGIDRPDYTSIDTVIVEEDAIHVIGSSVQVLVWTWNDPTPPLAPPPDALPEPLHPLVQWDADLEVGATYRYPLYIHCGMGYLGRFNQTHWYLTEAPEGVADTGFGDMPSPAWPVASETIYGAITLVDSTTIEYTIPEIGLIAVYEASEVEPPGCA